MFLWDGRFRTDWQFSVVFHRGLVLGPLFFLIFINDLEYEVENWTVKFADDTDVFDEI